jgi:hypothetical protein
MKRKQLAVMTAVLVAGLSASAAMAISSKAPIQSETTLTFKLQAVTGTQLDLGDPGTTLGDELISSNLLLKQGATVGRMESVCTVTSTDPLATVCEVAARLDDGQIALIGRLPGKVFSGEALVKVAIVGGTGAYRHVHGFARVDTTVGEVTFILTP